MSTLLKKIYNTKVYVGKYVDFLAYDKSISDSVRVIHCFGKKLSEQQGYNVFITRQSFLRA